MLETEYSTATAAAIADAVRAAYDLDVVAGAFFSRGFNDMYELALADGGAVMARLCTRRYRGAANVAFETSFMTHLARSGIVVGTPLTARDGALWRMVEAPEGPRELVVFAKLQGETALRGWTPAAAASEGQLADTRLLGASHAAMHAAGEGYDGPPSLYQLDGPFFLHDPLTLLLGAPTMTNKLRDAFRQIGERATARVEAAEGLTRVVCHGDNHSGNAYISDGPDGQRVVGWFDFDDCGPGFLAYDLAVMLWNLLRRTRGEPLGETSLDVWRAFTDGYRSVRPIPEADFAAIATMVALREIWFLANYATRIPQWGQMSVSGSFFRDELKMLTAWDKMETPS